MDAKTVSVAMATYNGAEFLFEQLESINNQTYKPAELIICDDCSLDDTLIIIRNFAAKALFPVYIYRNDSNLGFIDNFFKAISLCSGNYIALSDQDDVWEPNKLQVSISELERSKAYLHSHSATLIDKQGRPIGPFTQASSNGPITYKDFDPWNTFFGFTCTFKRDLLSLVPPENRPIDLIYNKRLMAHDRWITTLALCTGRVIYSEVSLARYRQHGRNVFSAKNRSLINSILRARNRYICYLKTRYAISNTMVRILRSSYYKIYGDNNYSLSVWSLLESEYKSRLFIFNADHLLLKRLVRLLMSLRSYTSFKTFFQDLFAILILAK